MKRTAGKAVAVISATFIAAVLLSGFSPPSPAEQRLAALPHTILWAWERPEDLSFLNPREAGVAYLAKTVFLHENGIAVRGRMNPLRVAPGTALVAVVRIESNARARLASAKLGEQHVRKRTIRVAEEIAEVARAKDVLAVQIDFDAVESERNFYRDVLTELRRRLPSEIPISITALASWCIGDPWIEDLAVDEAVPMLFRMGWEQGEILRRLNRGQEFRPVTCRSSVGIATGELPIKLKAAKRQYFFHARGWTREAFVSAQRKLSP